MTLKELSKTASALKLAKGEAMLVITQDSGMHLSAVWDGKRADLANDIITVMRNNTPMAAFLCKIAKDYLEEVKKDPQKWVELTSEVLKFRMKPESSPKNGGEQA
nr:hypothetical protein [uncultured Prevotella sp.]